MGLLLLADDQESAMGRMAPGDKDLRRMARVAVWGEQERRGEGDGSGGGSGRQQRRTATVPNSVSVLTPTLSGS